MNTALLAIIIDVALPPQSPVLSPAACPHHTTLIFPSASPSPLSLRDPTLTLTSFVAKDTSF